MIRDSYAKWRSPRQSISRYVRNPMQGSALKRGAWSAGHAPPALSASHPITPQWREPGSEFCAWLSLGITGKTHGVRCLRDRCAPASKPTECDMAEQLLLFANELRTRAGEILVRAASTDDPEAQDMMRVVAAGYKKLARRIEQRVCDAVEA
jgi:hypothetical protein